MLGGLTQLAVVAALVTGRGIVAGAGDSLRFGFYAAASLTVVGFAFVNPSISALISRRTDRDRQGEVLGVNQSFASLGRILGPLVGMSLFSLHPSRVLPYAASAVILVGVAMLMPQIKDQPAPPHPV
jgi:MFS family permease